MFYNIYLENTKTNKKVIVNFECNGLIKKDGTIEMIDNYLSNFKSLDDFITYLYKEQIIDMVPNKCYIKNDTKEIKPIFNDDYIHNITNEVLNNEKVNENETINLVKKIVNYAKTDERIFQSIKNTKEINNILYYNLLNSNLYGIKRILSTYSNFRDVYVWLNNYENKYYHEQEKEKDNQITFDDYLKKKSEPDTNYQKVINYLYDIDEEESKEILKELAEEQLRKNKIRLNGLSNENIEYYYNLGGINSVMENVSLDELESLSSDEKEYIGYRR